VQRFCLSDPLSPGHRKILVFWLVNPNNRVISTADVPPQQLDWFTDKILTRSQGSRLPRLPDIPQELIADHLASIMECPFSKEKAAAYCDELMFQRKNHWPMSLNVGSVVEGSSTSEGTSEGSSSSESMSEGSSTSESMSEGMSEGSSTSEGVSEGSITE
jgi:Protein of unknown function (DUF4246)